MAPLHRSLRLAAAVALLLAACADPAADPIAPASAKPGGGTGNPTITAADPISAPADTTLVVKVFGTNFDQGSAVAFLRSGAVDPELIVNSTSYRSTSELRANVTITPTAIEGLRDIQVTTSGGKKGIGAEKFQVEIAYDALAGAGSGVSSWPGAVSNNGLIAGSMPGSSCLSFGLPVIWDRLKAATLLPHVQGGCGSRVSIVNSAGVAAGYSSTDGSTNVYVRWLPVAGGYQVEELPLLPNGMGAGPGGINDAGQITSVNYAAVWADGSGWAVLTFAPGASICRAWNLNETGTVVGSCTINGIGQPVVWASATASPVLLPLPAGGTSGVAKGVNNTGSVVGYAVVAGKRSSYGVPVRWTLSGSVWTVTRLPDLGGDGYAYAINDSGQIAGTVSAKPALWDASGGLRVLEGGGSGQGEARGISEQAGGLVIGGVVGVGADRAVRWMP